MNAALYATLCLAAATAIVAAVGDKRKSCDDRADIICTEGCQSFITITNCTLEGYPKKPATTEICTAGYGRNTASAKSCTTGQGTFRCTGTSTGSGSCSGCVRYDQTSFVITIKLERTSSVKDLFL
ncbi:hypothetical protein PTTG_00374, partial [Puccinia triticina 1-1 BBBD Race 1]